MRYLIFCFLFIAACFAKENVKPVTSLTERGLKGAVKRIRTDSIIADTLSQVAYATFSPAGMEEMRSYIKYEYSSKWSVEYQSEYNDQNQLVFEKGPSYSTKYVYNSKNKLILEIDDDYDGTVSTHYIYNRREQLIKDSSYFSAKTLYYDKKGNLVRKERYDPRDREEDRDLEITYYRRNDNGILLEEWNGSYSGTIYTYDSLGQMLTKEERRDAKVPFGKGRFHKKREWKYNKQGDVILVQDYKSPLKIDDVWRYRFEYDDHGNWIKKFYIADSGKEYPIYERVIEYY